MESILTITCKGINGNNKFSEANQNPQDQKMMMMEFNEKLIKMKSFLEELGLHPQFFVDGKLYVLSVEDKYDEVISKCDELGVTYVVQQKPHYSPTDPITLKREIDGFIKTEWFEVRE